jgi:hypothetical protein
LSAKQPSAPDLRDSLPDAPENLVSALERALAKDPNERFQSALDFVKALS